MLNIVEDEVSSLIWLRSSSKVAVMIPSVYEQSRQESLLNLQSAYKIYEMFMAQVEITACIKNVLGHIQMIEWS